MAQLDCKTKLSPLLASCGCMLHRADDKVLFYSIRPSAGPATPLSGARVGEGLPLQPVDDHLLGQIDGISAGEITGWACLRGDMGKPLEVRKLRGCTRSSAHNRHLYLIS